MGFFQFGKRIKNRQFDYIPRYYDEEKEELKSRIAKYDREIDTTELSKQRIKGSFRRKYRVESDYGRSATRRSNRILLLTIAALLLITFFFITEYLPRIIASFEQ